MGDLEVELCYLVNSIVYKYCSVAFILMAKRKVFIHKLLRTKLYVTE